MDVYGSGMPGWRRSLAVVALACLVAPNAAGCKTGTAGTKPSLWTFGGGSPSDADKLATAPSFKGDVEKPSATAKPYPTTAAPNGYVLDGSARAGSSATAAAAPQVPAAVTYGVTPPPARPESASIATAPPAGQAAGGSISSIAPQFGPYGSLSADPPPSSASATDLPPLRPIGPAAATGGVAAMPPDQPAPQRVADARGGSAWPEQSPAAAVGGSRYDSAPGSRFGGGNAIDQPLPATSARGLAPPVEPGPPTTPEAWTPPPLPASPATMPSTPAVPALPAAAGMAPLAAPAMNPGAIAPPAALPPAVSPPPTRRPDPGYRPGGTSSYRPNREILAAEPPVEPSGVQTAGFETPAP